MLIFDLDSFNYRLLLTQNISSPHYTWVILANERNSNDPTSTHALVKFNPGSYSKCVFKKGDIHAICVTVTQCCYIDCASLRRRMPRHMRSLYIRRKWERGRGARARPPVPHFLPCSRSPFPSPFTPATQATYAGTFLRTPVVNLKACQRKVPEALQKMASN